MDTTQNRQLHRTVASTKTRARRPLLGWKLCLTLALGVPLLVIGGWLVTSNPEARFARLLERRQRAGLPNTFAEQDARQAGAGTPRSRAFLEALAGLDATDEFKQRAKFSVPFIQPALDQEKLSAEDPALAGRLRQHEGVVETAAAFLDSAEPLSFPLERPGLERSAALLTRLRIEMLQGSARKDAPRLRRATLRTLRFLDLMREGCGDPRVEAEAILAATETLERVWPVATADPVALEAIRASLSRKSLEDQHDRLAAAIDVSHLEVLESVINDAELEPFIRAQLRLVSPSLIRDRVAPRSWFQGRLERMLIDSEPLAEVEMKDRDVLRAWWLFRAYPNGSLREDLLLLATAEARLRTIEAAFLCLDVSTSGRPAPRTWAEFTDRLGRPWPRNPLDGKHIAIVHHSPCSGKSTSVQTGDRRNPYVGNAAGPFLRPYVLPLISIPDERAGSAEAAPAGFGAMSDMPR